jgi:elongation factor 2
VETITNVNVILSTYLPEDMQEQLLDPAIGNVCFGSGKECWGFRIQDFAQIYSKKLQCDYNKMCKRLWGDNFYDPVSKSWKKHN